MRENNSKIFNACVSSLEMAACELNARGKLVLSRSYLTDSSMCKCANHKEQRKNFSLFFCIGTFTSVGGYYSCKQSQGL